MHARRTRPADLPHSPRDDLRSDTVPPERPALWLQRTAGNHAVAGVLTRQPDAKDKPVAKNAPAPGEAQAKKLAALLPGKRADVLTELGKEGTDLQSVDDAAAAIVAATKNAKERDAMLLLRRCIAFVRHRPKTPANKAGPGVKKGGEGVVALDAKVEGGEIKVRTGVDANLGEPTFSLTYSGAHPEDCHWLQFIWREIVPQHEAGGKMVDDAPVAGRVERSAGFSYNLTTKGDAPEWSTDTADKKTAWYEEDTGAVHRDDKELAMFDDPNPRDNLLKDAFKGGTVPAHAVSRAHFDTYLIRGMDVLYRVRLDLSWQITNGKADAAPKIEPHGESMKGIRPAQLAKLKEQLGKTAELPDYLATADEKPAAKKPASKPGVQRDAGAFAPVKDLSKGSLPASEWDPKTRTKGLAYAELLSDIATLAGAARIKGVPGTATTDITSLRKKDPTGLKPGLNFVSELPGADGETGFINSAGEYKGAKLPQDGGTPKLAIMIAASAFSHDKAHALATVRHEMKHAEHFALTIDALEGWRGDTKKPTFDKWLQKNVREPNLTLIRERVAGSLPNTELLAYAEGLATSFQYLPQVPDPKLMMPGKYPTAIFQLIKAGQEDTASRPQVSDAADDRLREYCHNVLSAAERGALVAWIDFLSAYITAKGVPPEHKDADASWATAIKSEVKNIAPFLKRLRGIALKPAGKK